MIRKIIRSMTQGSVKTKLFLWAMILLGIASVALFIAAWIPAASGICTGSACIVGRCLCDCKFCYDQYTEGSKNQIKIHTMKEKKRIRHRNGSEPRQDIWPRFNRKMSKRY